ncbi:MAG: metallophosphoesterase [Ruminococcaceae bacterium]|nr:metallophosphoesterase [Oscillospiraceae bacterium]
MRVLVISDVHGRIDILRRILMKEQKAEAVFFLGDGENDIDRLRFDFPEKCFYKVRGNCDFGSPSELTGAITLEGYKIFYTHGHMHYVKFGDKDIKETARNCFADIVLYGHTHKVHNEYDNGLYIMNPGSLTNYEPSYGVIELLDKGILTNIVYLSPEKRW